MGVGDISAASLEHANLAFGLVLVAGLSTALGGAVVFEQRLVKLANKQILAAGLGLSAGVMIQVSFVEIFVKSQFHFKLAGKAENVAYWWATFCFFLGMVLLRLLSATVHMLDRELECEADFEADCSAETHQASSVAPTKPAMLTAAQACESCGQAYLPDARFCAYCGAERTLEQPKISSDAAGAAGKLPQHALPQPTQLQAPPQGSLVGYSCCSFFIGGVAESTALRQQPKDLHMVVSNSPCSKAPAMQKSEVDPSDIFLQVEKVAAPERKEDSPLASPAEQRGEREARRLQRMGLNTAAAIGIHNLPEGLAGFVATLADPAVGVMLTIAICIHNIPEGLCVALPIYYGTGSKWKGFLWSLLSGISEPIGALLGYAIIKSTGEDMSQDVYAAIFGVVAGMMVMIVMSDLIPTAYRYDPKDRFVTNSLFAGMLGMSASLCLFIA